MRTESQDAMLAQPNQFESRAEYFRNLFRTQGFVDVVVEAEKAEGHAPSPLEIKKILALVYPIRHRMQKDLGKSIVHQGNIFKVVEDSTGAVLTESKTKTAVLVVREVRDERGTRYELDVVGELNRGMMKEALKQLMEVFI